jgi:P pilus assembly chaperone PapD
MVSNLIRSSGLWLWSGLAMTLAAQAQAGIVLNTTRVIYSGADKEVSLQVHNTGTGDILAQSWLEADRESVTSTPPPFAITPSLARMSGDGRQLIRLIYSGEGLAQDRESVLWLNVQEIPQTGDENQLQIAIRQRIKLFYRPQGLIADPSKAAQSLKWQLRGRQLEVINPGPYHVSMLKIEGRQKGQVMLLDENRMLAPAQRLLLPVKQAYGPGPLELAFTSINDFGAQESYRASVLGDRATQASKTESRPD